MTGQVLFISFSKSCSKFSVVFIVNDKINGRVKDFKMFSDTIYEYIHFRVILANSKLRHAYRSKADENLWYVTHNVYRRNENDLLN